MSRTILVSLVAAAAMLSPAHRVQASIIQLQTPGSGASTAAAQVFDYTFTLTLEQIFSSSVGGHVGDSFVGSFQLNDDVSLLADGIYSMIPLNSWAITLLNTTWDLNNPNGAGGGSAFVGFRDGAFCGAPGSGFSTINPGLIVHGGEITGFCGGVFGNGDVPLIDFEYLAGPGHFRSVMTDAVVGGSFHVDRVAISEPPVLALLAMAGLYALFRQCVRRRSNAQGG